MDAMTSPLSPDLSSHGLPLEWSRKAIVVADLVESVRLMEQDEQAVIACWRRFVHEVVEELVPMHASRLVKSLGDGLLMEFDAIRGAAQATHWMHDRMRRISAQLAGGLTLELRCAVHVCERVQDEMDIYGVGVNLTARLAGLATPGGTVVSIEARDGLLAGLDGDLVDIGPCYLKHLKEPVRAFRLLPPPQGGWLVAAPGAAPAAVSKAAGPAQSDLRALVAVIPFDLRSSGAGEAHAAIGHWVAEGTIALLSKVPLLRVVSRMSTAVFHGRQAPLQEMSDRLGADYLLCGSYAVAGDRVILTAEAISAKDRSVLWADRLFTTIGDLLEPQSEALTALSAAVERVVVQAETQRARLQAPPNLESYSLLIGSVSLMHRSGKEDFQRARELLAHLVDRHPRLASPRSWMALWYVLRVTRGHVDDAHAQAGEALDHARRARESDPGCSLALTMQGFVETHMLRRLDDAESTLNQALTLNPSDSLAWLFKGVVHSLWGRGESALELVQEAQRLSPMDPLAHYYDALSAPAALAAERYELAESYALRSLRANRLHSPTWRALVIAQSELGLVEQSQASLKELLVLDPGLTVASYLARSPAGANDTRKRYAQALRRAGLPAG
jgi:class 3 adenylate cyclase/TolB-like protein/tetratricopeptide (TPR) repeat protein